MNIKVITCGIRSHVLYSSRDRKQNFQTNIIFREIFCGREGRYFLLLAWEPINQFHSVTSQKIINFNKILSPK